MKAYPKYKDSKIDWIKEIPDHWNVKKIKHACYVKGRVGWKGLKASEFLESGYAYLVTGSDFAEGNVDWASCYHIDKERYDEDPYIQLQDGDLLITKDGTIGKLAIVSGMDKPACLNSGIFVVRSVNDDLSTRYLFWILDSDMFTKFNEFTSYGSTIQHLYQNVFIEFSFIFPPIHEQDRIANFLDQNTAAIDILISQKQRLIELLQEEKTAVISTSVTQGLDRHVPRKPAGIPWLGDVPAHWEQIPIKHLLHKIIDTEHKTAPFYDDGDYFVCRTSNIRNGKLLMANARFTNLEGYKEWTKRGKPEEGDIVFTREAPAGEACIVPSEPALCLGQRTVLFKADHSVLDAQFGVYSIYGGAASKYIEQLSQGSTVAHFNMADIRNIPMLIPLISEQKEIVEFLSYKTAQIDQTITQTKAQITLLREYRTSLISQVVTGKIDVRQEVVS